MSLKEKLGGLTQKLETEKKEKKQTEQDEQLKPVRANIKELEKSRKSLDLIKNSLDFKELNRPDEHIGMKDYAERTDKKVKSKSEEIDTLISGNKEALNNLGIEDKDQLSVHPEFAEESEVIEYKKATKQGEELKMSDAKLKERLTKLGIEIDSENFSYESASHAVGEKIENINKELTQEKLKTPEGREEIINNLAEEFGKNIGEINIEAVSERDKSMDRGYEKHKSDLFYDLEINHRGFYINFKDEKVIVKDWSDLKFVPDNFKDAEVTYGKDIIQQALERTYQNKVHAAFSKWDETNDKAVSLKEQIKAVSPEEKNEAREKMDESIKKQNELFKVFQKKADELKEKGIDFSPTYARDYGKYREIIEADSNASSIKYINEILDSNDFPPRYNYIELQESADRLISWIDKFTEVIRNIKDKEDIENLLSESRDSEVYVGKFSEHFSHLITQGYDFRLESNNNRAAQKLTEKCKTYQEAKKYLDEIIEKNIKGEHKVTEALIIVVQAQLKGKELEKEIKEVGLRGNIHDLESKVNEILQNKNDAIKIMGEIEALQSQLSSDPKLSEENLILESRYLIIPSLKKEYDDLRENKPLKYKEWEDKKAEREKYEETKPGLFGKEKRQTKLTKLKGEEAAVKMEYESLEKKDQDALYHKAYHFIESDQYTPIGKMVGAYKAQGNALEIFNGLKSELTKVIDATLPPKIMADYAEYKTLVEKIS